MTRRAWGSLAVLLVLGGFFAPPAQAGCNGICAYLGADCFWCELSLFDTDRRCHNEIPCIYCLESDCEDFRLFGVSSIVDPGGLDLAEAGSWQCSSEPAEEPPKIEQVALVRHPPRT